MHMRLTKAIETKTKWLNIHLSPLFDYSDTLWQLMIIIFCLSLRNILKSKVGSCIWILFGKCFLQKLASALKNFFFLHKSFYWSHRFEFQSYLSLHSTPTFFLLSLFFLVDPWLLDFGKASSLKLICLFVCRATSRTFSIELQLRSIDEEEDNKSGWKS